MKSILSIILISLSLSVKAQENEVLISSWSNQPYSDSFSDTGFEMRFSFDNQLSRRNSFHWMEFINWDLIQRSLVGSAALVDGKIAIYKVIEDVGDDYITSLDVLDSIKYFNPSLFEELTQGLDLSKPSLIVEKKEGDNRPVTKGFSLPDEPSGEVSKIPFTNKLQTPSSESGLIKPQGILTASDHDYSDLGIYMLSEGVNDWRLLNNRWNALDIDVKYQVFRLEHLSLTQKVKTLSYKYVFDILGYREKDNKNFLDKFGKDLPDEYDRLSVGPENSDDYLGKSVGLEFRLKEPISNPVEFLEFYYEFNRRSNRLYFIQNPLQRTGFSDGDYHLHISVSDKRGQTIQPIVRAWNHLVALTEINVGNSSWYKGSPKLAGFYKDDIKTKGFVRLVDDFHVEIRNQIKPPEETLEIFIKLFQQENSEAVDYIYKNLLPKVTQADLIAVAGGSSKMFNSLIESRSFLETLDFEIDGEFENRLFEYLKSRLSNAEAIDLGDFNFLGYDRLAILRDSYLDAIQKVAKNKVWKNLFDIMYAGDNHLILNRLSLDLKLTYLESYLSHNEGPTSKESLGYGLFIRNRKEIADWYINRRIGPSEEPSFHEKFLSKFIEVNYHYTDTPPEYWITRLTPKKLSFLFNMDPSKYINLSKVIDGFSDEDLKLAIKYLFTIRKDRPEPEIDPILMHITIWLNKSDRFADIFFDIVHDSKDFLKEQQIFLNFVESVKLDSHVNDYKMALSNYLSRLVSDLPEPTLKEVPLGSDNGNVFDSKSKIKACTSILSN